MTLLTRHCVCVCLQQEVDSELRDTVGAVVLDCSGHIASASSSGGIMLKHPGRVGQVSNHLRQPLCPDR